MTTANEEPKSRLSKLRQAFKEHTGIRLSTATAIVYAALSIVFACKAAADRPKNVVPLFQCAASVCLATISGYQSKNHYRSHFNEKESKAKFAALEERTRELNERLTLYVENNKPKAPAPVA